jgi:hypothetical protein
MREAFRGKRKRWPALDVLTDVRVATPCRNRTFSVYAPASKTNSRTMIVTPATTTTEEPMSERSAAFGANDLVVICVGAAFLNM